MNVDFRVKVDFFSHHKTRRLQRRLGAEGVLCLLQFWAYVAKMRADGDISDMTEEDMEVVACWDGEEGVFVAALQACGFVRRADDAAAEAAAPQTRGDGLVLHDWAEHNPWAAEAYARSNVARLSRMAATHPEIYARLVGEGRKGVGQKEYWRLIHEASAQCCTPAAGEIGAKNAAKEAGNEKSTAASVGDTPVLPLRQKNRAGTPGGKKPGGAAVSVGEAFGAQSAEKNAAASLDGTEQAAARDEVDTGLSGALVDILGVSGDNDVERIVDVALTPAPSPAPVPSPVPAPVPADACGDGIDGRERAVLQVLQQARGGYTYDFEQDLAQIRILHDEYPGIDLLEECRCMVDWLGDRPRRKIRNSRLFLRNWVIKAQQIAERAASAAGDWNPAGRSGADRQRVYAAAAARDPDEILAKIAPLAEDDDGPGAPDRVDVAFAEAGR